MKEPTENEAKEEKADCGRNDAYYATKETVKEAAHNGDKNAEKEPTENEAKEEKMDCGRNDAYYAAKEKAEEAARNGDKNAEKALDHDFYF